MGCTYAMQAASDCRPAVRPVTGAGTGNGGIGGLHRSDESSDARGVLDAGLSRVAVESFDPSADIDGVRPDA